MISNDARLETPRRCSLISRLKIIPSSAAICRHERKWYSAVSVMTPSRSKMTACSSIAGLSRVAYNAPTYGVALERAHDESGRQQELAYSQRPIIDTID